MASTRSKLDEIVDANPAHSAIVADLRALVRNFELKRYMATVEALRDRVAPFGRPESKSVAARSGI